MRAQRYRSPCLPQLRYKTISLGGCDKKPLTRNKELDDDKTKAIDIIPTLGGGKMLEVSKQRADTFKESGLMTQSEHASHDFLESRGKIYEAVYIFLCTGGGRRSNQGLRRQPFEDTYGKARRHRLGFR